MNTKTILIFVTLPAALAVVITPSLIATAAAAPNIVCEKNGKTPKGQEEPDTPPGQADCPKSFDARNENVIKDD